MVWGSEGILEGFVRDFGGGCADGMAVNAWDLGDWGDFVSFLDWRGDCLFVQSAGFSLST
jgi:hypothetical protein